VQQQNYGAFQIAAPFLGCGWWQGTEQGRIGKYGGKAKTLLLKQYMKCISNRFFRQKNISSSLNKNIATASRQNSAAPMRKIKYLEGVRGVAALIVVLNHIRLTLFMAEYDKLHNYIHAAHLPGFVKTFLINGFELLLDGDLAVWVFWLLSSYVISIAFFKPAESYDKVVVAYAAKRYFRLFIPVFVSIMAGYVLMKTGLMYNAALAKQAGPPYSNGWLINPYNFSPDFFNALLSAVYNTFMDYDSKASYNPVLWTIEIEFLGSLFTFSIFGVLRHNKKRWLLYAAILAAVYALKMYWLCCFVAGHVLCDYDCNPPRWYIGEKLRKYRLRAEWLKYIPAPAAVLLIFFARSIFPALHIPLKIHNLLLSFMLVLAVLRIAAFRRFFAAVIPFWLGRISFSLYLIHLPVICSLTSYIVLHHFTMAGRITGAAVTLIVSLVVAWYYTIYIDLNGVKLANKIGDYFKRHTV
jgi:peptidoglycan/LPS O-acetylase OafA/YrhL